MADNRRSQPHPRGRRPAGENTRAALLAAARVEFTERGFDGATVRAIAQRAGVDAAMVNHWFGGKERNRRPSLRSRPSVGRMKSELIANTNSSTRFVSDAA